MVYAFTSLSVPHSGHSMNTPNNCPSLTPSASVFPQFPHSSRSGPSPLKAIFPFGGAWMIALARGASSTTLSVLSAMRGNLSDEVAGSKRAGRVNQALTVRKRQSILDARALEPDAIPSIDRLTGEIPPGSPVEQLAAASELAAKLRARGDELLDHYVDAARAGGSSWSEIGCSLGTSKQAAQQRFAALADPPAGQAPFGLTGPAADAMSAAAAHARELGHHYVRPEHVILALVEQPEELAGQVLAELGVTPAALRAQLERRLGTGPARPTGSLGVAPQTKRLLELARSIAGSLGHRCPRTEHVLLAATSPRLDSAAATLLSDCGAPPSDVRDRLVRTLLKEAPELAHRLRSRYALARVRSL